MGKEKVKRNCNHCDNFKNSPGYFQATYFKTEGWDGICKKDPPQYAGRIDISGENGAVWRQPRVKYTDSCSHWTVDATLKAIGVVGK